MKASQAEFDAWMAKYEPVERAVFEVRERRARNRERRQEQRRRRFGDICEATEGQVQTWMRSNTTYEMMFETVKDDPWALQCFLRFARTVYTKRIKRLTDEARRPLYYEKENARRRALAAERRKVTRRRTTNPCPTREQILDAWTHRHDSHDDALRFGSIIMDLECYLDNSLLFSENGAICGRRGGIKRWLQEEIPALYLRYTTVMRFKAMAKKLRQIVEIDDPVPAAAVMEDEQDYVAEKKSCNDALYVADVPLLRARAIWLEVTTGAGDSATALMARIDALLDPRNVAEVNLLASWRAKYENEIMLRRKKILDGNCVTRCKRDSIECSTRLNTIRT